MKIKTSALTDELLNRAVTKCEVGAGFIGEIDDPRFYSTDWALAGPIIERERIAIWWVKWDDIDSALPVWTAVRFNEDDHYGPTPLIAAMRCYVASKLGDEIELLEELS